MDTEFQLLNKDLQTLKQHVELNKNIQDSANIFDSCQTENALKKDTEVNLPPPTFSPPLILT